MSPTLTVDTDSEPGSWERAIARGCGPQVTDTCATCGDCANASCAHRKSEIDFNHGEANSRG